jgi:tetratricopeptide (TPR) repeat protein
MNSEELLDWGLTCQMRGDLEKAEGYLKKAIAQTPSLKGAHLGLGDVYLKKGRFDLAEEMYTKELDVNLDSVKAYLELAYIYLLRGEEDKALSNFEKALAVSPDDWRVARGIGYICLVKGELDKAIGWFKMAIEGKVDDLATHFWLVLVYNRKGLVTEMDAEIERVKAICDSMGKFMSTSRLIISYILGKVAFFQGRTKEAIEYLEEIRKNFKLHDRKRMEFGLIYNELDVLKTLADIYERVGEEALLGKIKKEIAS